MSFNKWKETVLALLAGLAFVLFFYPKQSLSPNSYLFSAGGDGIKNYYSYLYNSKHDSSFWYTESMNYPYGELLLFTDGQPLLASSFRLLKSVFPFLSDYGVAYLNLWMLVSLILAMLFIFMVLRKLSVGPWASLVFGLGILALQPQIFRFPGHFGLSYAFVIPMTIYLLLSISEQWNLKLYLGLILSNFLVFFLHPYLGLIFGLTSLFFAVVNMLIRHSQFRRSLYIALGTIGVILGYLLIVRLTDDHQNRTPDPFGFFFYRAQIKTIFLPHHPPLKPWIQSMINIGGQQWEGWAYMGVACTLGLLYMLLRWFASIKSMFLRKTNTKVLSYVGLVALLFSMAVPFVLGLEFLVEQIGPLKQFRSLGRFAWIAYYLFNFLVCWKLYALYRLNRKRSIGQFARLFILVPVVLMFWEAWPWHKEVEYNISLTENLFLDDYYPQEKKDFAAIIGLPLQVHGSENFELPGDEETNTRVFLTSYATGIPIYGGASGRSSVTEARKLVQSIGPSFYSKEIKDDMAEGDFLVMKRKDFGINRYERNIWNRAKPLYSDDRFEYASISSSELLKFEQVTVNDSMLNDSALIALLRFDDQVSDQVMNGTGAKAGTRNHYLQIANFGTELQPGDYVLTMWVYTKGFSMTQMGIFLEARYKGESSLPRLSQVSPGNSVVIKGDWSMVEMPFTLEKPIELLNLVAKGGKYSKQPFYFDNLMLRPQGKDVLTRLDDEHFIWNGYVIPEN